MDEIYKTILTLGLLQIREAALLGDAKRCYFEAEHLHNLPSLIGESNINRHLYYFNEERVAYVEACKSHDADCGTDICTQALQKLVPHWDDLLKELDSMSRS